MHIHCAEWLHKTKEIKYVQMQPQFPARPNGAWSEKMHVSVVSVKSNQYFLTM